ncbi:MAG: hypothetical protein M0Q44_06755 [Methylobacter sp.]|nr:hypothetical protein [Methylobacter sp.]
MKTLIQKTKYFSLSSSKGLITLIFASVISVLSISIALADHDNGHGRRGNWGDDDGRQEWRGDHDGYGRFRPGYPQPYNYAQPVYVPPPVYYPPQQSPGISLFFPLNLRR